MGRLENCVLNLKNRSHSVTAEIVVPENGAEGVIVAQGANIGGWSHGTCHGRQARVLLQPWRDQTLLRRVRQLACRRTSGPDGIRLTTVKVWAKVVK